MRNLLLSSFAILVALQSFAQGSFRRNTLYGELLGNGLFLSVNYERQMGNKPGLGLHVGIGIADIKPAIPLGVTYLFDLGNYKSFIETGAGITLADQNAWEAHFPSQIAGLPYRPGYIPSIGYRHHTSYGLFWKLNYTPVFTKYRNIPLFFGFSTGWRI